METMTFPQEPQGLIFDCDGVMIDSEAANRFFYDSVLSWLGLPSMTPEQEKYAFMATATDALKAVVPQHMHERIPEAIEKGMDYNRDVMPRVKLMPGFLDFIKEAYKRGLHMAIDTNRTNLGIQRVLDFFELTLYFNPVVSSSMVAPKPSPEGVFLICKQWGKKADQLLFIGDSQNDCDTAKNAGAMFAAFGNGGLECDCGIKAVSYKILANILWPAK